MFSRIKAKKIALRFFVMHGCHDGVKGPHAIRPSLALRGGATQCFVGRSAGVESSGGRASLGGEVSEGSRFVFRKKVNQFHQAFIDGNGLKQLLPSRRVAQK